MTDLSECRILIVDDVPANIDILVGALRADYKLSVAIDGPSALRAVEKSAPDLILLDIMMPGMDGYEVCRRLRADAATRELPIMFLSALEDVENKALGFEAGANDYLTKPFEILEVQARVKSLLKAKMYADAVREAMDRDLRIAREIQMGILPGDLSSCTTGTGLDIDAFIEPARQVGGDLYEVVRAGDDRVVVVIGDVMGKGIPASLFMAVTLTLLRTFARQVQDHGDILACLNGELVAQNPRRMFVTMACLVFDLASGRVTGASAGHTPLLLIPAQSDPHFVFSSSGMVLGMMPRRSYTSETLQLRPGDTLMLYTDGITEAENVEEEQFENDRLLRCFTGGAVPSAREANAKLMEKIRTFTAGAQQTDDITLLSVRYTGRIAEQPHAAAIAVPALLSEA
jgi:sigma-B regulation protein RsbU (phosphoserine phosphatase)